MQRLSSSAAGAKADEAATLVAKGCQTKRPPGQAGAEDDTPARQPDSDAITISLGLKMYPVTAERAYWDSQRDRLLQCDLLFAASCLLSVALLRSGRQNLTAHPISLSLCIGLQLAQIHLILRAPATYHKHRTAILHTIWALLIRCTLSGVALMDIPPHARHRSVLLLLHAAGIQSCALPAIFHTLGMPCTFPHATLRSLVLLTLAVCLQAPKAAAILLSPHLLHRAAPAYQAAAIALHTAASAVTGLPPHVYPPPSPTTSGPHTPAPATSTAAEVQVLLYTWQVLTIFLLPLAFLYRQELRSKRKFAIARLTSHQPSAPSPPNPPSSTPTIPASPPTLTPTAALLSYRQYGHSEALQYSRYSQYSTRSGEALPSSGCQHACDVGMSAVLQDLAVPSWATPGVWLCLLPVLLFSFLTATALAHVLGPLQTAA